MDSQILDPDRAKDLLELCRAGLLYEIDAWIVAENSIQVSLNFRRTPLQFAIHKGFHSLVLLRPYPDDKMRAWKVSNDVGNVKNN
jgi:hypothetical protein